MSTILKALRRLEDDRSVRERRPLREQVVKQGGEASGSRARWVVFLALGGGVAVGAGVLAFMSVEPGPQGEAPAVAAASPVLPPALTPPPAGPSERRPAVAPRVARRTEGDRVAKAPPRRPPPAVAPEPAGKLPPAAFASGVAVVDRPQAGPRISSAEPIEPIEPGELAPPSPGQVARLSPRKPAPAPPVDEPVPPVDAPEPPTPMRVAAAEPAPLAPARREPARAVAPERREPARPVAPERREPARPVAPERREPARATVSEPREVASAPPPPAAIARPVVPEVRVQETRWHPDAARRTAVVQLEAGGRTREVHEGDAVGPLLVTKIEPSGVVFDHDGLELRRRIGAD